MVVLLFRSFQVCIRLTPKYDCVIKEERKGESDYWYWFMVLGGLRLKEGIRKTDSGREGK